MHGYKNDHISVAHNAHQGWTTFAYFGWHLLDAQVLHDRNIEFTVFLVKCYFGWETPTDVTKN